MNFLNYLEDAITLFAIVNPIGNLPIFIQLTSGMKHEKRDRTINIAVLIAFLLLVIFSMSGDFFMARVFKITLNEIKFIGGIVLMVLAVKNLGFDIGGSKVEKGDDGGIAAFPLAFPILVAAVSLVTGLMIVKERGYLNAFIVFLGVFVAVWLVLWYGTKIISLFGNKSRYGLNIFSKIMYILLAAKAVKVIMSVVATYIKS